jgi:two-component system, NarL family, nitrate/nitrite response regulator NarL
MRLVICDDHRLLLEALATALAGHGYIVEALATTPDEAVSAVARHDPDVLLIDLRFPDGHGLDASRQVLSRHPRTKVVVLTGTDDPNSLSKALELGVSGYVLKGERVDAICAALDGVARGETVVRRSLLRQIRRTGGTPEQPGPVRELTAREQEVLDLLKEGLDTQQIVQRLVVSPSTVRTHVQNILSKLGVHSRLQAVALLPDRSHEREGSARVGRD